MQQLLGDRAAPDNAFLKELFLQCLPANVRMVLASADTTTELPKLAEMADKIMEVARPPTVAAISAPDPDVQQLKAEVSRLADLVASLTQYNPQHSRSRSRTRRPPSPARTDTRPSQDATSLCWYHRKFGEAAKKCQQPCSWEN